MNPILRAALVADVAHAVATAKAVNDVNHLSTRGRLREVLISELFRPLFPSTFEIMTGVLVDHTGNSAHNQSGQEDILIYSREVLPGGMRLEETGLLPIEACVAVIEVKSTLTASGVKQSIEHAQRVRGLQTVYEKIARSLPIPWPKYAAVYPIYNVFALQTDLTSNQEWERFSQTHREMGYENSAIFSACIVGSGMAEWHGQTPGVNAKNIQVPTNDFAEIISFISFVSDYARELRKLKLNDLPSIAYSHYVLP